MKPLTMIEYILLAMIWGASFLFMRVASPEFGPVVLIALRVSIAVLCLSPLLLNGKRLSALRENKVALVIVGLFNSAFPFCLFAYATLTLSAGYTSVINASAPLWAALIAFLWLQQKVKGFQLLGLAIGFIGVVILVWNKLSSSVLDIGLGIGAGFLASIMYGYAVNYTKTRLAGVEPLTVAIGSQMTATAVLLPFLFFDWPTETISVNAWLSVIALGVLCTALAYVLYFKLIAQMGGTNAITVTYLIPLFGSLFGYWFLAELMTLDMVLGGLLIILGTALVMGGIKLPAKPIKANSTKF